MSVEKFHSRMKKKSLYRAFTLAEVLITLGIIGVVAAITIPTLIAKNQKTQTLAGLKKSYAMLQTMYQKALTDNGDITSWGLDGGATSETNLYNTFAQYLNISKSCGITDTPSQCWAYGYNLDGSNGADYPRTGCIYALLNDGSSLALRDLTSGGVPYVHIYIDMNGLKGPNKWGIDRFAFEIMTENNYKLMPLGKNMAFPGNQPSTDCCWQAGCTNAIGYYGPGTGRSCSLTIINYDNWQMTEDNPYWK